MASVAAPAPMTAAPRRGFNLRWLDNALAHGYIWAWLAVFAMPFVAITTTYVFFDSLPREALREPVPAELPAEVTL